MAIVLTDDEFVTLDESQGLQNTGIPGANEDNNDNDIVISRPGPRIVDGLDELARVIHPDAVAD